MGILPRILVSVLLAQAWAAPSLRRRTQAEETLELVPDSPKTAPVSAAVEPAPVPVKEEVELLNTAPPAEPAPAPVEPAPAPVEPAPAVAPVPAPATETPAALVPAAVAAAPALAAPAAPVAVAPAVSTASALPVASAAVSAAAAVQPGTLQEAVGAVMAYVSSRQAEIMAEQKKLSELMAQLMKLSAPAA